MFPCKDAPKEAKKKHLPEVDLLANPMPHAGMLRVPQMDCKCSDIKALLRPEQVYVQTRALRSSSGTCKE